MTDTRILVVEDEPGLQRTLNDRLTAEGFSVDLASDARGAAALWRKGIHEVVLLDLMLPDLDGLSLLQAMRREGLETPVLVLTARDSIDDKVVALGVGADDYLTKPFEPRELVARLRARLRRHGAVPSLLASSRLQLANWVIDLRAATVSDGNQAIELSSTEWSLLSYMARHHDRVISREELLREVWGYAPDTVTRTVDQHIAQLRQKLEPDRSHPHFLVTVHGQGYVLRGRQHP